jgi:FlaA1/EpsC-like NDP-sugar epimerase
MKRLEVLFSNQTVATIVWMLIDIILINIAFIVAYWVRYDLQLFRAVDPAFNVPYRVYLPFVALFTALLILVYRQQGVYRLRRQVSWVDEVYAILSGTATATIITIVIIFLYRGAFYSRLIFIYAGMLAVVLLGLSRLIRVSILRNMRRRGIGSSRVLIVGAGEVARSVMRVVVANPECGLTVIGFLDDHPAKAGTDIGRFRALGRVNSLSNILVNEQIDEVIITLPWQYHRKIMSIMTYCERNSVRTRIVPDLFQMRLSQRSGSRRPELAA